MRAAERRYHKGRGANPGMDVNPGAAWAGAGAPAKCEPRSGVIIVNPGIGAGGGVPAKCEPRSGVIIKAGVSTPALMWTDVDLTFL
jgi:hypothetical protein